jgi:DNA-binding MarR family transcriptional regulator
MIGRGHEHHHHGFGSPSEPPDLTGVEPSTAGVLSAFRQTMHLNRQLFMRLAAGSGGHSGRTIVLGVLASHDGITQKDLAERMHLARPTVTTMLQKMEHEGLIERWDDPEDQRLTRIRLTDAGRTVGKDMGDVYARYVNMTIGTLSEADRLEFARLLGLMSDNITAALKELDA